MIVKVNKTILKSIWQRPLKSLEDTDWWGVGGHDLTLSQCPGNKCSMEVRHTFEGCFCFSFFHISKHSWDWRTWAASCTPGTWEGVSHWPWTWVSTEAVFRVSAPQTQSGSCSWVDRRGDPQYLSWPPSHKAQIPLMAPDLTGSDCRCQSLLSELQEMKHSRHAPGDQVLLVP